MTFLKGLYLFSVRRELPTMILLDLYSIKQTQMTYLYTYKLVHLSIIIEKGLCFCFAADCD